MTRLIGIVVGLGFSLVVLLAFVTGAYTAATEGLGAETAETVYYEHPMEVEFSSDGPFGTFDRQQLQRGYQVYKEVCAACHSLRHVAFRDLGQLGYTEAQVKAEAATWSVPAVDPNTGEATTQPGSPTDYFPSPYANDVAASAANGGKIPPDLSLITKARHDGGAYVHSLLVGYEEQPAELLERFPDAKSPVGTYYNPYFPALNIGMPPPLTTDGQVTYADGTEPTIDQMSEDVSAFLIWTAEPTLEKRHQTGWAVLGFLLFATILAYLAKKQVWSAVKPKKKA
ncbi:ubiquinol-cytochrome c reductase cytochrome c1 subunit [Altererythrobacter atlanticus]|uniref:Cytochrome c1 n=1 Tax=Croceibacterium atlanticum TaxID=1267766 RepID=A0A0F7KUW5_9SPHN|nr:cytochrome c1 [Croceibacterium atlanticum]AKH43424.1 Cytochrome b/c1 [Croceibacterium atlanticum]MBB5731868.1 ubiquinol-cytochrome c reductase cytochrome c1 subunit [Croceibacterium atlanticum]